MVQTSVRSLSLLLRGETKDISITPANCHIYARPHEFFVVERPENDFDLYRVENAWALRLEADLLALEAWLPYCRDLRLFALRLEGNCSKESWIHLDVAGISELRILRWIGTRPLAAVLRGLKHCARLEVLVWDCNFETTLPPRYRAARHEEHLCPLLADVIYSTSVEDVSLRMDTACAQALAAPSSAAASPASCCPKERYLTMERNGPNTRSHALPSFLKTLTISMFLFFPGGTLEDHARVRQHSVSCGADIMEHESMAEHRQEIRAAVRDLVGRVAAGPIGNKVRARMIYEPRERFQPLPADLTTRLALLICMTGQEFRTDQGVGEQLWCRDSYEEAEDWHLRAIDEKARSEGNTDAPVQ